MSDTIDSNDFNMMLEDLQDDSTENFDDVFEFNDYPFITNDFDFKNISKLLYENDTEFAASYDFSPEWIDKVCYNGC